LLRYYRKAKLGDGLFLIGARLIVKDGDCPIADLEHIDVAGQYGIGLDRNPKAELPLHVGDVLWREVNRHFDGHGH
jgi:hypothetical protein